MRWVLVVISDWTKAIMQKKDSSCYTEKEEHFCTKIDLRLIWEGMPVDYFFFEMVGYTVTNLKKTFFFSPVTWWACAVCYLLKSPTTEQRKKFMILGPSDIRRTFAELKSIAKGPNGELRGENRRNSKVIWTQNVRQTKKKEKCSWRIWWQSKKLIQRSLASITYRK